jgi:surface polysaccharide O-acyltransferase-like enzyme
MNNIKKYGSLIFCMLSCFTLGMYTMAVKYNIKPVEIHQWFLTSMFGIYFLMCFIDYLKKDLK